MMGRWSRASGVLAAVALLAGCGGATPTATTEYETPDAMIKAAGSAGYQCGTELTRSTDVGVREFVICADRAEFSVYSDLDQLRQDAAMLTVLAGGRYSVLVGPNWLASFPSRHDAPTLHEAMGGELKHAA